MKIYFEDGPLYANTSLELGCDHIVNAACGYSNNESAFDGIMKVKHDASIYTNSLVGISNSYCWNEALMVPELYLRSTKTGEFVRVDILTNSKFRPSQHLLNLYRAGALYD